MDMEARKVVPIVLILVFVSYLLIFNGFFQQDEWVGFGWYFAHKDWNLVETIKFLFAPNIGHYNPLTSLVWYALLSVWELDYTKYALFGVLSHLIVTLAVYFLAKLIFKKRLLAIAACLLFGVFASPFQGTAWVVVNISTLWASFFGVASAILFFNFLRQERVGYLVWSLVLLVISLLFKEITIGLFALYLMMYLFGRRRKVQKRPIVLIVFSGAVYALVRLTMLFAPNVTGDALVTESLSISEVFYNFVTLPFKSITQIIFPLDFLKHVASGVGGLFPERISGAKGSPAFEVFVVKRIMEVMSIAIAVIVALGVCLILKRKKRGKYGSLMLIGLGWTILNAFIFSLAPEAPGVIFAVDSRNLYFGSIGMAIFIVAFIGHLAKERVKKFVVLFLPILVFNIYGLQINLSKFTEMGIIRKNILNVMTYYYPNLPQRTVFYIVSDSSYYGLPPEDKIPPFQSGFGQTLLVWYSQTENFPDGFYENRFLWGIKDQGYKEFDGRGFGYFRELKLLENAVSENRLSADSVIAFSWDSKNLLLRDITKDIRERVKKK